MQLLYICLKAPNCEAFDTWGFTDKYSWLKSPDNALPFDKDYKKKNAYWWMRDLMRDWDRNDPATVERLKRQAKKAEKKRLASLPASNTSDHQFEVVDTQDSAANMFLY